MKPKPDPADSTAQSEPDARTAPGEGRAADAVAPGAESRDAEYRDAIDDAIDDVSDDRINDDRINDDLVNDAIDTETDTDTETDADTVAGAESGADAGIDETAVTEALVESSPDEFRSLLATELASDATQHYLNQIGQRRLLTPEQEQHFATLAKQGDFPARQVMIEHNLRLVVSIAKHYVNRGVVLLDLVEEGNLGLMHSIGKFEPERGFRFSTYATWWIRQAIERAIMNQARTIRLPVHRIRELNLVLRAKYHLEARMPSRHEARIDDIAHLAERSVAEVREILGMAEQVTSLDTPLDSDPQSSLIDLLADAAESGPDAHCEQREMIGMVRRWLDSIPIKQRLVIMRRYGLDQGRPATLEELAEEMGVTRERVRQIQQEGLHRLKRAMTARGVGKDALL